MVLAYLAEFALYANFEKLGPKAQPVYENAEEIKKHELERQKSEKSDKSEQQTREEAKSPTSSNKSPSEEVTAPPGMVKSSSKSSESNKARPKSGEISKSPTGESGGKLDELKEQVSLDSGGKPNVHPKVEDNGLVANGQPTVEMTTSLTSPDTPLISPGVEA
jgi:hypothetical protein